VLCASVSPATKLAFETQFSSWLSNAHSTCQSCVPTHVLDRNPPCCLVCCILPRRLSLPTDLIFRLNINHMTRPYSQCKGKKNTGKGCKGTKEIRCTQGRVKTRRANVQYTRVLNAVGHCPSLFERSRTELRTFWKNVMPSSSGSKRELKGPTDLILAHQKARRHIPLDFGQLLNPLKTKRICFI
jgi:hypothetical protein